MMIIGFCTKCKKIKQINVHGSAYALAMARGGCPEGICSSCKRDES